MSNNCTSCGQPFWLFASRHDGQHLRCFWATALLKKRISQLEDMLELSEQITDRMSIMYDDHAHTKETLELMNKLGELKKCSAQ